METKMNFKNKKKDFKVPEVQIDSSLGLLAYGDIAFLKWRELKKEKKKNG
jgi:hypothetical protein